MQTSGSLNNNSTVKRETRHPFIPLQVHDFSIRVRSKERFHSQHMEGTFDQPSRCFSLQLHKRGIMVEQLVDVSYLQMLQESFVERISSFQLRIIIREKPLLILFHLDCDGER